MTDWTDDYKAAMRAFMEKHGRKIDNKAQEDRYAWEESDEVSPYGWADWDATVHVSAVGSWTKAEGCHWVVPEGARLYEREYSMFAGTFVDNKDEVGINVTGCRCACGKYQDVILRYTGTLAEVMQEITGAPARAEVIL